MKTGGGFSKQADLILMGLAAPFLLVLPFTGCGPATPGGLEATASQRVHPVLIRNEHNPLANVTVEAGNPGISAESFTFTLSGTDDPNDIESLQLFYSGDKQDFEAANSFGEPVGPTDELVFSGHQKLSLGKNVFWLSVSLRRTADLGRRIDAACTLVRTSAGEVTPTDNTPDVRKRIGVALRDTWTTESIPIAFLRWPRLRRGPSCAFTTFGDGSRETCRKTSMSGWPAAPMAARLGSHSA
jgi:hypothetical protein